MCFAIAESLKGGRFMNKEEHMHHILEDPVYAIMGEELSLGRKNVDVARQLIAAGVQIIQYREKHKTWRKKFAEASVIAKLCRDAGVTFIMNDSPDLAIACGASGIHVGQDDAPVPFVRRLAGDDMVIGVSTNTIEDLQGAVTDGADYVGFGPMFPTQSKKDANEVVTEETIAYTLQNYPLPVVTIGGISLDNIGGLYQRGYRSFAMISAIISQPDIAKAVQLLRQQIAAKQ
jgi:thiamine-phosphate pyrophosphorylase